MTFKRFTAIMLATVMSGTVAVSATACAKTKPPVYIPTDEPTVDVPPPPDVPPSKDEEPETPVEVKILSVRVKEAPTKIAYKFDETLDVSGGMLSVMYTDGQEKEIAVTSDMCSGFDSIVAGEKTVTVTYEGQTCSFKVTVNAPALTGIALANAPTKLDYTTGEMLDVSGGRLSLLYNYGNPGELILSASMCSAVDMSAEGTKTVTVKYLAYSCSFDIVVKAPVIDVPPVVKPEEPDTKPEEPDTKPEDDPNAVPDSSGLIQLPNYTVSDTYPDYGGSENAPIQGSGSIPGWILPNDAHHGDGDYECTDPSHAAQLLEISYSAQAKTEFARSLSLTEFAASLLSGVTAQNKITGVAAKVSLAQLDSTVLATYEGAWLDLFTEGAHTAVVQATDTHGRTIVMTVNFDVVITEPTMNFEGETPVCHIGKLTREVAMRGFKFFANGVNDDNLADYLTVSGLDGTPDADGYVTVTYTLSDADVTTQDTTVTRRIRVVALPDFVAPAGTKFLLGADQSAFDAKAGLDLNLAYAYGVTMNADAIHADLSGINWSRAGVYTITYKLTDALGETCTATSTLEIVSSPTFGFAGNLTLHDGDTLDLAAAMKGFNFLASGSGITAENYADHLSVTGLPVGSAVTGTYTLTYTLSDLEDLTADLVLTRTVTVVENPNLVIPTAANYLIGSDKATFDPMAGVSGTAYGIDNANGSIKVNGFDAVNFDASSIYNISYSLTDSLGKTVTAVRQIIIRDYSKQEAIALYSQAKATTAQQYWETSSTANYNWSKGTSGYKTHIYRANTAEGFVFGFAVDSENMTKLPTYGGNAYAYASVNDGAILLRTNGDGTVSVKRTDPNYDGGFYQSDSLFSITTATPSHNLLSGFSPSLANFTSACTTNLGNMSVAEVLSTYGIDMNASTNDLVYNFSEATTKDASVKLPNQVYQATFSMNASALDSYVKLMGAIMPTRWNCYSTGKEITITMEIDRATKKILNTSIANEEVNLELTGIKRTYTSKPKIDSYSEHTSVYGYSQTLNYSATKSMSATAFAMPRSIGYGFRAANMSAPLANADGSYVYDDGSCSCCPDGTIDEGSVRVDETSNVPGITFNGKLNLPATSNQNIFYKWLFAGASATDGDLYVAAIKRVGETDFVKVTADTDLAPYLAVGDYVVKYYAIGATGNYTFLNRTVSVVAQGNSGILIDGATLPTVSGELLKLPANPDMDSATFSKLLGKDLVLSDGAEAYLVSLTDKNGSAVMFDDSFDMDALIQKGAATYTVKYYIQSEGAYTFFERTLELFGDFNVPRFTIDNSGYSVMNGHVKIYLDTELTDEELLKGVTVTDPTGETLNIVIDRSHLPASQTAGASGYVLYTATNSEGKTSTAKRYVYFIDYAKPVLNVDNSSLDMVSVPAKDSEGNDVLLDCVRYFADETLDYLAYVTANDVLDGVLTNITVDTSKMPTSEGGIGYAIYTVTNAHGKTTVQYRYYTLSARPMPTLSVDNSTLPLDKDGYATYYYDSTLTDEMLLVGIVSDSTLTIERFNMDAPTAGQVGYVVYTATNQYGKSVNARREYRFKDYSAPVIEMTNGGIMETLGGKDYMVCFDGQNPDVMIGVSATDELDGAITVKADISKLPTAKGGVGEVVYTAINSHGKVSTMSRYYYMAAPPKITDDDSSYSKIADYLVIDYSARGSRDALLRGIATDAADGNLSYNITTQATLDNPYQIVEITSVKGYGSHVETRTVKRYFIASYRVSDMGQDTIAIYKKTESKMASETYKMMGRGVSDLSIGNNLTIYSTLDHTPTEMYLDNVSSGGKVVGVNTSFGARAYINSAAGTYRIGKTSGQGNTDKVIATNGGDWGLGSADNMSATDFQMTYFGRTPTQLFGYPVNANSTSNTTFSDKGNGTYEIFYKFKTEDSVVGGYCKQVNTISGQTVASVEYAEVTMTIDNTFRIVAAKVHEKYKVTTMGATTANDVNYTYAYGPLTVRKF